MSELSHRDFAAFFQGVWGVDPFPWQQDLLTRLATGEDPRRTFAGKPGEWPAVLDLPTGSGKTAALDIALFHLALEAGQGEKRRAPVRIALVVDRRLIVDDAHARAEMLARKLKEAIDNPAGADAIVLMVAQALSGLAGAGQPPLVARRLRGGAPREDDWARTPVQPTILCSTVDQVGSRLLFRGYGVGDSMKPIHAGLLGSDCLILLDEAHLSEPFRQTLQAVERLRGGDRERAPFGFAVLTATPQDQEGKERFGLSKADEAHRILACRIDASKPARLVEIASRQGIEKESRRAEAVAEEAAAVLGRLKTAGIAHPAVGVVLNRVARARAVFEQLEEDLKDTARVILLIGPARAVDRDALAQELEPIRTRQIDVPRELPEPLIIVATQTIEAGVDIDFDGLVTEAAALDALRQRLGRLNRAGREIKPEAAILAHKDDIGTKADDPVYGDRVKATWNALKELAGESDVVDFGIRALRDRIGKKEAAQLAAPAKDAPVLRAADAHLWSHTAPIPIADSAVALFLHGPDRSPASVQIVWRADIDREDLLVARNDDDRCEKLVELFRLVPPRAAETVDVPLWAACAFLEQDIGRLSDLSDISEREPPPEVGNGGRGNPAFRWTGDDKGSETIFPSGLAPGDLIVVPASYGGCDKWGWNPKSGVAVMDRGDAAAQPHAARRYAVRLTPVLLAQGDLADREAAGAAAPDAREIAAAEAEWEARLSDIVAERDDARSIVDALLALPAPDSICVQLERLTRTKRRRGRPLVSRFPYATDGADRRRGLVLLASLGIEDSLEAPNAAEPWTEDDEIGSTTGHAQSLAAHTAQVQEVVASFAQRAGLSNELAHDLATAALLHDVGKADPRFQSWLTGGSPFGWDENNLLAKSGTTALPKLARTMAGLPDKWRHEALSVRAAIAHPALKQAHDRLLVLWLIGTHHGHGRPNFPHADPVDREGKKLHLPTALGEQLLLKGKEPGPQSLAFAFDDLNWAEIFVALKEEYGIWGVARLEAFMRLADHRASELGAPLRADQHCKESAE